MLSITGETWPWALVSQRGVSQHCPGQANTSSSWGQVMPPGYLQHKRSSDINKTPLLHRFCPRALLHWHSEQLCSNGGKTCMSHGGSCRQWTFPHRTTCKHLLQKDMHPEGKRTFLQTLKQNLHCHQRKSQFFVLFFNGSSCQNHFCPHLPGSILCHCTEMLFFLKASSLKDTAKKQLN